MDFSSLPISPALAKTLAECGLSTPTPIQATAIPVLLSGRDLIARAPTGTGKTAAFSVPILERVKLGDRRPGALVLCPTRELCTQVAGELRRFGRSLAGLRVLAASGGQPVRPQADSLERGAHVVVGTPGRVLDLLERGSFHTAQLSIVVLDEADRMLDMGFRDDLERILSQTPEARQTALFSATLPPDIEAMSARLQRNPARAEAHAEGVSVHQEALTCPRETKPDALATLLGREAPESAIVFVREKATAAELSKTLRAHRIDACAIHGDLEQDERDRAMAKLRNRSTRVLVATDVAARGLDVPSVDLVVHFDLPNTPESWTHRIGRTGRAGREGRAFALVSDRDLEPLAALERALGNQLPRATIALGPPTRLEAPMRTLLIHAGRRDKLRPGDILGALTGEGTPIEAASVGKIEVGERVTFVAVERHLFDSALRKLRDGRIKARKLRIDAA